MQVLPKIDAALLNRKGAVRLSDVKPEVLAALNSGALATVNLMEWLALDKGVLAQNVAKQIGLNAHHERLQDAIAMLPSLKSTQGGEILARALYEMTTELGARSERDAIANRLATHPSDTARCWAAAWVKFGGADLQTQLEQIRRFAEDTHFGVREMAWIAVRDKVIAELPEALKLLQTWVRSDNKNVRRFASELTRPCGVWCAHITALKEAPWLGLTLIEPLKNDPSKYVQNSVANWLNDAAKSQPDWVKQICSDWSCNSKTANTAYIVKRALRSFK